MSQNNDDDPEMEIEYIIPDLPDAPPLLPNMFWDPVAAKSRRLNIEGDQRIIRALDDVEVPEIGDAVSDIESCLFKAPKTAEAAATFCQDLRINDRVFQRIMKEFQKKPDTVLGRRSITAAKVARDRLFQAFSIPNHILETKHKFTHNWVDEAKSLEPPTFLGILHATQILNKSAMIREHLLRLGPTSPEFEALASQQVFNPNSNRGPIMQYSLNEVFTLIRFLERQWNNLEFVPEKLGYLLDVIIARLAELLTVALPESEYVNLTAHRRLLRNGMAVPTTTCFQDFFWALIPMHRTLTLRTQFEYYRKEIPFSIDEMWVEKIKSDLKARIKQQNSVEPQNKFYTKYSQMCLRFSERKRYIRDHPGADLLSSSILTEMRGAEAANLIQEKLAPLPWDLIDAGQMEPHELDVLWLILFDMRFNNVGTNKFDWAATAVRYRGDMVDEEHYVQQLRQREYPVIVQSFNTFGVFFEDSFYDHRCATKSVIHWLLLVLLRFKGVCNNSNLTALHVLIPNELKQRLGIRFKR